MDSAAPPAPEPEPPADAPPTPPIEPAAAPSTPPAAQEPAPPAGRPFLATLREAGAWMSARYLRMDPRTAGIFRIVLGALCAADVIRHWSYTPIFYSNDGVLTNHWHLFKPSGPYNLSLFHAFGSAGEVHLAFALALFCHLCLMVGWHARLFAVLTFVSMTSLDNRLVMVENGGYVVVNLVTFYACFLPVERRFSVDALLRSYRERRERTAADLDDRRLPASATDDYVSLAAFLVVLNLAAVYFFNVVNKSGEIWRKGETVHYVLWLNRMVTGLAVFFRKILPMWSTRGLTWLTVCVEAMLVPWILWPFARRLTRTLALVAIWGLHFVFGIMFRLGPFAWFMIAWSFVLPAREQWDLLDAFYRRRAHPTVVVYDRASPLAFLLCRQLSRMNGMDLLRFEESAADEGEPELLAARDEASGARFAGAAALREIVQALPGGKYAYPLLRPFLGPLFAFASARREGLARFFGLSLPSAEATPSPPEPPPILRKLVRQRTRAREMLLAYLGVAFVWQAVTENKSIPEKIRTHLPMPGFMSATIGYPRLFQGWGMFAPNPITDDGTVVVDGRTVDGRTIDPFTGKEPDFALSRAQGLGLGQIPQDYFNRIRLDRNTAYRQGLGDYLRAWHLRTGRPEDELVAFDVYWVRDQCPSPDRDLPYDDERIALLTWRKQGYRPPVGQPPLPPEPKVASAETPQPDKAHDVRKIFGFKLPDFMQ